MTSANYSPFHTAGLHHWLEYSHPPLPLPTSQLVVGKKNMAIDESKLYQKVGYSNIMQSPRQRYLTYILNVEKKKEHHNRYTIYQRVSLGTPVHSTNQQINPGVVGKKNKVTD